MEHHTNGGPRIKVLADRVAKIIAAGEVIDRPFSVVRELIDNSIDALATEIILTTERGGIDEIRITDNGCGMSGEDIRLCWLPHATSKITEEEDIYKIRTLGFRGEALSSIGTCARLEIASRREGDRSGHRIVVHGGKIMSIEDSPASKGTVVSVSDLFYNMPARKKFLKTPSGEQGMCRSVFVDKALPFENIAFRFFAGKELKMFLPATSGIERVASVYSDSVGRDSLFEEELVGDDFSIRAVLARPEVVRKDKKLIQIFVNRRKIYDYALVQAVEYGYSGYVPGKDNPIAFVFIDIDPGLVDFNVHPAKRECRIRIMADLHKALVTLVKGFASRFSISLQTDKPLFESPGNTVNSEIARLEGFDSASKEYVREAVESRFIAKQDEDVYGTDQDSDSRENRDTDPCKYIGQAFDLFLIAEKGNSIYLIDQHAAHERILFEQFRKERSTTQELLFPIAFETTQEEKASIESLSGSFRELGIALDTTGPDTFEITALPAHLVSTDPDELVRIIKCSVGTFDEISDSINAMAACRNAIKEGEKIDGVTALHLIRRTFGLENARCPHGRPIWFTMTKDKLYNILGRK